MIVVLQVVGVIVVVVVTVGIVVTVVVGFAVITVVEEVISMGQLMVITTIRSIIPSQHQKTY